MNTISSANNDGEENHDASFSDSRKGAPESLADRVASFTDALIAVEQCVEGVQNYRVDLPLSQASVTRYAILKALECLALSVIKEVEDASS